MANAIGMLPMDKWKGTMTSPGGFFSYEQAGNVEADVTREEQPDGGYYPVLYIDKTINGKHVSFRETLVSSTSGIGAAVVVDENTVACLSYITTSNGYYFYSSSIKVIFYKFANGEWSKANTISIGKNHNDTLSFMKKDNNVILFAPQNSQYPNTATFYIFDPSNYTYTTTQINQPSGYKYYFSNCFVYNNYYIIRMYSGSNYTSFITESESSSLTLLSNDQILSASYDSGKWYFACRSGSSQYVKIYNTSGMPTSSNLERTILSSTDSSNMPYAAGVAFGKLYVSFNRRISEIDKSSFTEIQSISYPSDYYSYEFYARPHSLEIIFEKDGLLIMDGLQNTSNYSRNRYSLSMWFTPNAYLNTQGSLPVYSYIKAAN